MISEIKLQNLRSYKEASFTFDKNLNIIVGPNGSGKTTILEAILFLAKGKSYRAKDIDLIKHGNTTALISGKFDGSIRSAKISNQNTPKLIEINSKTYRRMSRDRIVPVILFEPEDLLLLSGSPERRRVFIDDILESLDESYAQIRRQHKRALSQRNHLLGQNQSLVNKNIFIWNVRLSELAGRIASERVKIINHINDSLSKYYQEFSRDKSTIEIKYINTWPIHSYESMYLKDLEENLEKDRLTGFTSSGPHREDVSLYINGHKLDSVASRGEAKTVVLALKMIELKLIEEHYNKSPILLLDDVFSELDKSRRERLIKFFRHHQTFITTTNADIAELNTRAKIKIIKTKA